MGIAALVILVVVEVGFFIWSVASKSAHEPQKRAVLIAEFALLAMLLATGVLEWGFRYYGLLIVMGLHAMVCIATWMRKREKAYALGRAIRTLVCNVLICFFALSPAILFPQHAPAAATGRHAVATAEAVWADPDRIETLATTGEIRSVDVALWYPQEVGRYPLVVFSHGAFGLNLSNESTFVELASNGYVVASIGHPYHAFYAKGADGKPIIANIDFINSVYRVNAMEDGPEKQAIIDGWMEIRLADTRFALDTIAEHAASGGDAPFDRIDTGKIGLFGHSLGGASAAQLGRERPHAIGAVIDLDGTMLGETLGFDAKGEEILNDEPYPVPLLNVYSGSHYDGALAYGDRYANFHAQDRAAHAYAAIIRGAGHLNFTDLPLFAPLLAKLLGVGTVDARYAIETTNAVVLEFFNYALKGGPEPQKEREC